MSIYGWFVVILVTSIAVMLGVGWLMERGQRQLDRMVLLDQLEQATANVQPLPRAGRLPYQGAQDPAYQLAPIPWDLASAAYALGQQRASQDEVTREVEAIFAEVEGNPERWQR